MTKQDTEQELAAGSERHFSGQIGAEYDMLRLICPAAGEISRRVGEFLKGWRAGGDLVGDRGIRVIEIGCGTGITTEALLSARADFTIDAVDVEPTMLAQAKEFLTQWVGAGRVRLVQADALTMLRRVPANSVDVVASAYAFHNFLSMYRHQVIAEVHRVLRPGGIFVNGDRFALDDAEEHTRVIQDEARHYFATFSRMGRYDLLENWIIHLFSDESPSRVMRLESALREYSAAGFGPIEIRYRQLNNALVTAEKPRP